MVKLVPHFSFKLRQTKVHSMALWSLKGNQMNRASLSAAFSPHALTSGPHTWWVVKLRNWRDGWFILKNWSIYVLIIQHGCWWAWSRHRSLVAGWQVSWPVDLAQVVSYGVIDPISAIHRDCTRSQKFDHRNSRQVRPPDDGCSVRIPCWVHLRVYDISMICISLDWLSFCVDMIDMTIRIYSCKCSTSHTDSIYLVYIHYYTCVYSIVLEMVSFSASKILKMYPVVNRSAPFSISMVMISSEGRSNASPLGTAPIDFAFLKWGTPNHRSHGWPCIESHRFWDPPF